VLAEIDFPDVFIINNLARRARSEYAPLVDDVGAIANAERFPDIVVGDQHADAALFQEPDDFLDVEHGDRINARKRFVEEDEARSRRQRARDLDPTTLKGHIRARYLESQSTERGEPTTPAADFTFQYNAGNRVLELKFTKPLERFRTLRVELLEGILGTDAQPLKPWTLTFSLGGS